MVSYNALYLSLDLPTQRQDFPIEAKSPKEAKEKAYEICPRGFYLDNLSRIKSKHGGKREGAGAPQKFGEATKALRIPQSLADNLDLIIAIPELQKLLDEWEEDCDNKPNSSRHYYLKKALADIRALGY